MTNSDEITFLSTAVTQLQTDGLDFTKRSIQLHPVIKPRSPKGSKNEKDLGKFAIILFQPLRAQ